MKNYWFACTEGEAEGEEFFVQEESKEKAFEIAKDIFGKVKYFGAVSDYTAEEMGLDTY